MPRRVVLARGQAISASSGLGRAHADLLGHLNSGQVAGWELSECIEHDAGGTPLRRVWRRWRSHPRRVAKQIAQLAATKTADLLHISDQEQAGLVPKNSPIPVAITVHDLFHLDPTSVAAPEGDIAIGEQNPNPIRKRDLSKIHAGLSRADLLLCDSETTRAHASRLFPQAQSITLPLGLNIEARNPSVNPFPRPKSLPTASLNLLIVGSEEPRKRLGFALQAIGSLPNTVREQIIVHKVGAESHNARRSGLADQADQLGVELNWLGRVSEDELIALEQHADALLFPSAAEGFGYPPLEAMAAGCPVLMSDLGSHNELAVEGRTIDPFSITAWQEEISKIHSDWSARDGKPRTADLSGLERAKKFSSQAFVANLQAAYDSLFSN